MSRYGHESRHDKAMILDFWLTVGRRSNDRPSVRVTADYPDLGRHEVTLNLKMTLPLALWDTPQLVANIEVASPVQPVQIDATVLAEAVRQAIGMDVDISVRGPDE